VLCHLQWKPAPQLETRDEHGAALEPESATVWLTLHGRYLDGARHVLSADRSAFGR
jgi:hypothetical protein